MSLVEVIVSMGLTIALSATILSLVAAGQAIARTQPESSDLQQRARIALQVLGRELRDAGAGPDRGVMPGPLIRHFPPVVPSADGGITIWKTTSRDAQGTPALATGLGVTTVALQDSASCLAGQAACAFTAGTSALAFTTDGCRTAFRIATVAANALTLDAPLAGCELPLGAAVAEGEVRTYRVDPVARQLVRRDEATGSSAPMLDGVASMTAAYFADAAGTDPVSGVTDGDLMRVRRVRLTLRLIASNPLLHVPDLVVAVDVAPRNFEDR